MTDKHSHLPPESLIAALQALRFLAEGRTSRRNRDFLGASQSRLDATGRPMSPAYDEAQQPYDPACVFDLEVMISMASKAPDQIAETW
jgi:brefeldin A-resistance guanine nucleotide exchange factor 1